MATAESPVERKPRDLAGDLPERLVALDVYRGLVMLLMMAEVLHLNSIYKNHFSDSPLWAFLGFHQDHVPWIGCSLHDLIQPSFSFLVGAALPFSLGRRKDEGEAWWMSMLHAFGRAAILVLLGVFLRSFWTKSTNWTFEDTLSQIGLGYGFLYLIAFAPRWAQWTALATILIGYWLAFAWYPLPGADFDWTKTNAKPGDIGQLEGFAAHWSKNTNLAWAFDRWFLNLFPRPDGKEFLFNGGGYATLSFIPTLGTMILGLFAGQKLREDGSPSEKIRWLFVAALISLAAGWLLGAAGICPVVKRIWTPSWVLFSGGWCFLFTAAFYAVTDVGQNRGWAMPLIVIGMNSIAAYLIAHGIDRFIASALPRHFGEDVFLIAGEALQPFLLGAAILFCEWLILFYMYRQRIFIRI